MRSLDEVVDCVEARDISRRSCKISVDGTIETVVDKCKKRCIGQIAEAIERSVVRCRSRPARDVGCARHEEAIG